MNNKDKEIIKSFVLKRKMGDNRESCLIIALENARILCGLDKETGEIERQDCLGSVCHENNILEKGSFIGLINYLLILDMLGAIFSKEKVGKRINFILEEYGGFVEEKDRVAIYTLRNTLAHNYGLADNDKKIKFILDNDLTELIVHPDIAWNGSYSPKNDDTKSTQINPRLLINRIEEIYRKIRQKVLDGSLLHELNGGDEELETRFTIIRE